MSTFSSHPSDPVDDRESLVIALDFGTTFSGIAYSFSTDPEKIYTITNWPGGEDRIVPKTPTVLQYEAKSKTQHKWGYELEICAGEKITALKLLLDPEQKRPYAIATDTKAEIAKLPKAVVDVAADYMKAIFNHALQEIEADSVDGSFLDLYQKKYILTVSAVWSDKAKSMTLEAARRAGITAVEMITEPEAAALYTLHSMKSKGLENGDSVIICDASGGTVDLVSYEIESLDPFKLRGLTAPSGGVCGSLMVNNLFEEEVRKTVGDAAYAKLKDTDAYRSALKEFDTAIKPAGQGQVRQLPHGGAQEQPFQGPGEQQHDFDGAIFDPIMREIEQLVSAQVQELRTEKLGSNKNWERVPKAIFLVGGFGSSAYLKKRIEESQSGVLVIQPKDAWSAIVRGAAMSRLGIAPIVTASKAAKHYGITMSSLWDARRDKGRQNDDLIRDKKIKHSFYNSYDKACYDSGELEHSFSLYESNATLAPTHPTHIKQNCSLRVNLAVLPKSQFTHKTRRSDGAAYVEVRYNLVIEHNQSGLMKFSIEADGKLFSAVEARY